MIWEALKSTQNGTVYKQVFNKDVVRGGVKVDTGREMESGYVISKLSLAFASTSDTGNYSCRLENVPKKELKRHERTLVDYVFVHVLKGETTEAIQSLAVGLLTNMATLNLLGCVFSVFLSNYIGL